MSDADCTPGREPRSVAASYFITIDHYDGSNKIVYTQRQSVAYPACTIHGNFGGINPFKPPLVTPQRLYTYTRFSYMVKPKNGSLTSVGQKHGTVLLSVS